ncbi:MAG: hypothetical protein LBS84_03430, partial [Clostridiales bacterium]|nr:hypothetical protein [Clostridiales bacterium]
MKFLRVLSAVTAVVIFGAAPVSAQLPAESEESAELPNFISFSGTIKEIQKPTTADAGYKEILLAENDEGGEMAFKITDDTYFVTDKKAEAGAEIIGFYDGKAP